MFLDEKISKPVDFIGQQQRKDSDAFIENGFLIRPVEHIDFLNAIRSYMLEVAIDYLQVANNQMDITMFFDHVHHYVDTAQLNPFRLHVINSLLTKAWFRPYYYHLAKSLLQTIVGSELVMQRNIGLSIQLPQDDSSLLNLHADSWSGDSPYEAVVWLPLVDCFASKSMYILSPQRSAELTQNFPQYKNLSNEELITTLGKDLTFITIKYGEVLIFNQNLPHGNITNTENQTRWSMNCRFKSIFSPYADKKLGEFFLPITVAPMTKIGMQFQYPKLGAEE